MLFHLRYQSFIYPWLWSKRDACLRLCTAMVVVLCLFCKSSPVYAQTVLRFENIDRISYQPGSGSLSFYEKKDSLYRQVFPGFDSSIKNGAWHQRQLLHS